MEGDVGRVDIAQVRPVSVTKDYLDLIRGDIALSTMEDKLAAAHEHRTTNDAHYLKSYIAIGDFLQRYSTEQAYDYTLVDLGPSSGALTRSFFLACDAFFIPVTADRFCVQATQTLGVIIEHWIRQHEEAKRNLASTPLPIRHGRPVFLGAITQLFKTQGTKPQSGYQFWLDRIPRSVDANILARLRQLGDGDLTFGLDASSLIVADIPHFEHLAPLMQAVGKPVFDITQEDTAVVSPASKRLSGHAWALTEQKITKFRQEFEKIRSRIKAFEERA
jgi:MinD-like ATPase involved in chromosome partitioning or flagellar assembly